MDTKAICVIRKKITVIIRLVCTAGVRAQKQATFVSVIKGLQVRVASIKSGYSTALEVKLVITVTIHNLYL